MRQIPARCATVGLVLIVVTAAYFCASTGRARSDDPNALYQGMTELYRPDAALDDRLFFGGTGRRPRLEACTTPICVNGVLLRASLSESLAEF
jgi:hypothetical protein